MRHLIVKSPLDVDFYKFTMAYFVWKYFPNEIVEYRFKNRTKGINLGHLYFQVQDELDKIRSQYRYTEEELNYVANLRSPYSNKIIFPTEFIYFLSTVKLPEIEVSQGEDLDIFTRGEWKNSIWWETISLSTVNRIVLGPAAGLLGVDYRQIGTERLMAKIEKLKQHPTVRFSEFGTRRRFSYEWQKEVIEILMREVPNQLLGTSNVLMAKELGLRPIGTMAHELFMVCSRLFGDRDEDIYASHGKVLDMWYDLLGEDFSIALTDTFGTEFFFRDFGKERAEKWLGMRQDSGYPDKFLRAQKGFYAKHGVDSTNKLFVPSDGLDVDKIISLDAEAGQTIKMGAGWGTDLTNDIGLKPLSIVMKATSVNGKGTVKLSDNIKKATGLPEDVERYKRIFNYTNVESQELVY